MTQPLSRLWEFSGQSCPKCGDRMILNKHGHECGSMYCSYNEVQSFEGFSPELTAVEREAVEKEWEESLLDINGLICLPIQEIL